MIKERDVLRITKNCDYSSEISNQIKSSFQQDLITKCTIEAKKLLAKNNTIIITIHIVK